MGTFLKLILRSGTQADRKKKRQQECEEKRECLFFHHVPFDKLIEFLFYHKKATKKGQEEILPLFVIIDARLQVHRLEVRHLREHHRLQAWS